MVEDPVRDDRRRMPVRCQPTGGVACDASLPTSVTTKNANRNNTGDYDVTIYKPSKLS